MVAPFDKQTIDRLAEAPLEIIGHVAVPCGNGSISLKAHELEAFCNDPEGIYALRNEATKDEYLQWVETEGTPRCGVITSKGNRCQNIVSGGTQMPLERWLQEDGGFCTVHGGATSAEARPRR